mmetsp:Transcript_121220/g.338330  ORF Transcript_121220/g.338330 Transcript_121220/m.338330 type:complete len:416 (+) Transcript_121220:236-1483(+)
MEDPLGIEGGLRPRDEADAQVDSASDDGDLACVVEAHLKIEDVAGAAAIVTHLLVQVRHDPNGAPREQGAQGGLDGDGLRVVGLAAEGPAATAHPDLNITLRPLCASVENLPEGEGQVVRGTRRGLHDHVRGAPRILRLCQGGDGLKRVVVLASDEPAPLLPLRAAVPHLVALVGQQLLPMPRLTIPDVCVVLPRQLAGHLVILRERDDPAGILHGLQEVDDCLPGVARRPLDMRLGRPSAPPGGLGGLAQGDTHVVAEIAGPLVANGEYGQRRELALIGLAFVDKLPAILIMARDVRQEIPIAARTKEIDEALNLGGFIPGRQRQVLKPAHPLRVDRATEDGARGHGNVADVGCGRVCLVQGIDLLHGLPQTLVLRLLGVAEVEVRGLVLQVRLLGHLEAPLLLGGDQGEPILL